MADRWQEDAVRAQQQLLYMYGMQQSAYPYMGLMGSQTLFGLSSGTNTYSGIGNLYYNQQMHEYQTQLGTPTIAPPAPLDPDEIAWLKGRVNEILWKPQKFSSGGRAL